jgi:hypothetical protein
LCGIDEDPDDLEDAGDSADKKRKVDNVEKPQATPTNHTQVEEANDMPKHMKGSVASPHNDLNIKVKTYQKTACLDADPPKATDKTIVEDMEIRGLLTFRFFHHPLRRQM